MTSKISVHLYRKAALMMYSGMGELMVKTVKSAGDFLRQEFGRDPRLTSMRTSVKEAATVHDKLVDGMIIKEIRSAYPDHSLLTEESGQLEGDPDWLWIVDSLDGTSDFANLNPFFCVCMALMHKQELVLGMVYAPAIDELYFAEKGRGAYLNGTKVHVSQVPRLRDSYVFYCEGGEKDRGRTGRLLGSVYPKVTDIRKLGSAGLETAWVAVGKGEAYFTTRIEPWDVAPGVLLLQEAGGMVTDFNGKPWKPETSDLVFSNGLVHAALLELLREKPRTKYRRSD